jgi:hypothetical protein
MGAQMATDPISLQQLRNASEDAQDLEHYVNDDVPALIQTRIGGQKPNYVKFLSDSAEEFQLFLLSSGYQDLGDYAPGIEITSRNQVFRKDGELWRSAAALDLPYITTGEWATEDDNFVSVGDAALRQELANVSGALGGAALVGYKAAGLDTRVRPASDRFDDFVSVMNYPLGEVDGTTINQEGIQKAVNAALAQGADLYWPVGTYVSNESIANFHSVRHFGPGVIKRGIDTWHITPVGDQENIQYVGVASSTSNDGLSASEPTTISTAFDRMRAIGDKASDGIWRVQLPSGEITYSGVTFEGFPSFRNRLRVWGVAATLDSVPDTVWNGAASSAPYALRADTNYPWSNATLHLRNLKMINFPTGGIVVWGTGDVLQENVHSDAQPGCASYRQCDIKAVKGVIANATDIGLSAAYLSRFQFGSLDAADAIRFENCAVATHLGRDAQGYLQRNIFVNNGINMDLAWSRVRSQGNSFGTWTVANCNNTMGIWTPDNGAGFPDSYGTITDGVPVMLTQVSGKHLVMDRYTTKNLHTYNIGGSSAVITGTVDQTLLSTVAGVTGGDFVPARVMSWWAYSATASLDVEMFLSLTANSGGTLTLHGVGSTAAAQLARVVIPANASARVGRVRLSFYKRGSAGRYLGEFNSPVGGAVTAGFSANLNNTAIRRNVEEVLLYRLYWTPLTTGDQATFDDMRSYIET